MPAIHRLPPQLALSLALVFWAGTAASQAITGTVDGEARTWHVLEHDGTSSASFEDQGMFTVATIMGFADPSDPTQLEGALEIMLLLQGQPGAMAALDTELLYMAGGRARLYLPDPDGEGPELTLRETRAESGGLFLSGRITAQVHRVVRLATEELDLDDSHRVEAEFVVSLTPG